MLLLNLPEVKVVCCFIGG